MSFSIRKSLLNQKGQLLIEAIVAFGLSAILLPALLTGLFASKQGKAQQEQRIQAVALMKEAEEAVRSVREKDWTSFAVDGTFHPAISGTSWSLVSGVESISGFSRSIVISDVYRDANGNIVSIGGAPDPSTKKIVVSVSWGLPYLSSVSSEVYLTRYIRDAANLQTTVSDFSAGTLSGTVTTNNSGGEVTLGAGGGGGDWCNPTLLITTVDLSRQGVPTSIGAYPGNIVTGTGGNASGPTFVKTTVSGNSPPAATINGQFDNAKANQVFTETTYGYIATTNHSEEIQILDLSVPSGNPPEYSLVGWFNAPGNGQGNSIFVTNNIGYMTDGNQFYTFDLSSRSGSRPQLSTSTVTLSGTGNKVVVVGNYAYVAENSTTKQLEVIDVTDPKNPSIIASANLGNNQPGMDVSVNSTGTRAYVVTSYASSSQPDMFIINTSTKTGSLPLIGSGFNTNGMSPHGINVATGNRVIIVGTGGTKQYQVVNISNETSPVTCGPGLSITNGAYAVASVLQNDGYAYSYVVTEDANAELKIILGGAGGQYSSSGTFVSSPFNAGSNVAFNTFIPTFDQPSQTSIKFQVASAQAVSGNCSNANYYFVGSDGTSNTYITSEAPIPLLTNGQGYANPGQCFKYKAFFSTSDQTVAPILYDVTVNYSP